MKDCEGHERICGTAGNMAPNCSCTEGENCRAVHAARGQSPLRCRARSREIGDSSRTDHKPGAEQGFDGNVDEQRDGDEAGHRVWDCENWKCGVAALVLKLQTACGRTRPRVVGGASAGCCKGHVQLKGDGCAAVVVRYQVREMDSHAH